MKDTELEKLQNLQHATKHRTDALRRCTRVRAVLQGPGRSLAPISKVRAVTVGPAPLSPSRSEQMTCTVDLETTRPWCSGRLELTSTIG